jgi:hypothetical protein
MKGSDYTFRIITLTAERTDILFAFGRAQRKFTLDFYCPKVRDSQPEE